MKSLYILSLFSLLALVVSAQDCELPTGSAVLDINNVNATIHNGQTTWQSSPQGTANYLVPAESGLSTIFAGSFWIGGVTPDQQLRLSAATYGWENESSFLPGPLSLVSAETDSESCTAFNQVWKLTRLQSEMHLAYFDCLTDGSCNPEELFPGGYEIPWEFYTYPAHGDISLGQAQYLAPFLDYDADGTYDPDNGDCPLWQTMLEEGCTSCDALSGDMCLYWIDNDMGETESGGMPFGIEIHNQAYGFVSAGVLNDVTFYKKKIINRGTQTTSETYTGLWLDTDIGSGNDDYVGCDINRNLGYAFNGDAFDESSAASDGYGLLPPAAGLLLLQGPMQDMDGVDNDQDGVVDNETLGMTNFMYYNNSNTINGQPNTASDYYNYLRSIWINGQHMCCGGDGLNPNTGCDLESPTNWMFGGDSYPEGADCGDWTEISTGNPPADRRFLMSSGPFTLEPEDEFCLQYAAVYSRREDTTLTAVEHLAISSDVVQHAFDSCFSCIPAGVNILVNQIGPFTYQLFNLGQGDVLSWDFGNGTVSGDSWPVVSYGEEGDFEVTLTVEDLCGQGMAIGTILLSSSATGVVENPENKVFSSYPNPFSDELRLSGMEEFSGLIEVIDLTGRIVFQQRVSEQSAIRLNTLAPGNYVIRLTNERQELIGYSKVIKQ
jgi:hypothetical protein